MFCSQCTIYVKVLNKKLNKIKNKYLSAVFISRQYNMHVHCVCVLTFDETLHDKLYCADHFVYYQSRLHTCSPDSCVIYTRHPITSFVKCPGSSRSTKISSVIWHYWRTIIWIFCIDFFDKIRLSETNSVFFETPYVFLWICVLCLL